jgi:hypothetical protein
MTHETVRILGPAILLIAIWLLWFLAAWYFGKQVEAAKSKPREHIEFPPEALTLVRAIDGTNYLRKFSVFIDGKKVGDIATGAVAHFPVPPGSHRVKVRVDFCTSPEFFFEKYDGNNQRLNCGSTYNDWRCIYMWLLKPMNYVYVRAEV